MAEWFNFRDVMHHCGIPLNNQNNWRVGHLLDDLAVKRMYPKTRPLTVKTDPSPRVSAPHCICHYPAPMFKEACDVVRESFKNDTRQLTMFDLGSAGSAGSASHGGGRD